MQLEKLGQEIRPIITGNDVAVITDKNVETLYLAQCKRSLEEAGFSVHEFVVTPGEMSKSGATYLELVNFLAEIPLTRADALIALGGGVVGDLTGFAAATYLRGIKVVQVPTTLLAAVDSSVGGKTAINLPAGKNLVGAFHQPALVCCDPNTLKTLPESIFRDGMAEVIKYGVIADAQLFHQLKDPKKSADSIEDIIQKCVSIKNKFVKLDEHDNGIRQILNFGHTIGHAIEGASDYQISHGTAVAMGMSHMADISARQGWCSQQCAEEIQEVIKAHGFPIEDSLYPKEVLFDIMKADKKRKGNVIDIVVPERIGNCRLERVTMEEFEKLL